MRGAKIFVTAVFALLGAAFFASSALFISEFRNADPVAMLLIHSHLFLFFPLFGSLCLVAFWLPSVVFTDMYWRQYIRFGRLRYSIGLIFVVLASIIVTGSLQSGSPRGIWEIAPAVLDKDGGSSVDCGRGNSCRRAPILDTLAKLRQESTQRVGLSKFARVCDPDPLLERPIGYDNPRYCFPALAMLPATQCCAVQKQLKATLDGLYGDQEKRSDSARLDTFFLFCKTFFIVIILVIGVLLVIRRDILENRYHEHAPAIERCMLVGAAALLIWPMMDYAYHQTMLALFGRLQEGPHFRLSLAIAPWFLLVLFYFLSRLSRKVERIGQIASVAASALALYRYDQANDIAVRFLGSGAPVVVIGGMVVFVVLGLLALRYPRDAARVTRRHVKAPAAWT